MAQGTLFVTDANGAKQGLEETILPDGNNAPNAVMTDANGNRALNDAQGNQGVQDGGRSSSLNITAAAVIKAGPGRARKLIILAPGGTSGAFTLNDCLTTGAASAANTIFTLPYNGANNIAGAVFNLDWPCSVGIVISAVPGSGSPIAAVSYD